MISFFFYLFSIILLASAAAVVTSRNPVHAVLFLILAFANASALFLIAGAEFLALILLIVYVGAVMVLFMFVVMMLDVDFVQLREGFQKYAPVGAAVGVVLLGELAAVMVFSWVTAPAAPQLSTNPIPANVDNTRALGDILYTNYIYLFQLAGLILLVSMIGAIVLTHRDRPGTKRQDITRQQSRMVRDTLEVLTVPRRAGTGAIGIYRRKPAEAAEEKLETTSVKPAPAEPETIAEG
jgi:NADH-quinone oxidoreductase subunit J